MEALTDPQFQAVSSRDARFDGWFVVGVNTTGIYCRPGCPARTPHRHNMQAFPTAAAAQAAGFRACRRCRPDAAPGSPQWDQRGDLVARAMRLIGDGVVGRDGVDGLARQLGYSARHLHRQLIAEVGAGAQALARAERAQTARILIETTTLAFSEVAFAADFSSIRQFNDTIRAVFAQSPTQLRRSSARRAGEQVPGVITVRLAYRAPLPLDLLLAFLGRRAVPGVERLDGGTYQRTLRLPHADGLVSLSGAVRGDAVLCRLQLADLRDLTAAVGRCRSLLDLDADPQAIDAALAGDPMLAAAVRQTPGRRVPGTVDGSELLVRAVLGQQVTVGAATTLAARLTQQIGERVSVIGSVAAPQLLFPSPAQLAAVDPATLAMPGRRRDTLLAVAAMLRDGALVVGPGADRVELEQRLLATPGIGPWTASYVGMRALRDPDRFLPGDTGVRDGLRALGAASDPRSAAAAAERWRPWRSYGVQHLWAAAGGVHANLALDPGAPAARRPPQIHAARTAQPRKTQART